MSRSPRLVIETFPNELVRTYHLNTQVANASYFEMFGRPDGLDKLFGREPLDDKALSLVDKLHGIDGVVNICLDIFYVKVTKAQAFDWDDDIEPAVLEYIKEHLEWSDQDVDIRRKGLIDNYDSYGRHDLSNTGFGTKVGGQAASDETGVEGDFMDTAKEDVSAT